MADAPLPQVSLSRFTTMGVGGPADYLVEVEAAGDLPHRLGWAAERGLPCLVLGQGSNVIVADDGFRGLVVVNQRRRPIADLVTESAVAEAGQVRLRADGGADLSRLAQWAAARGLSGLEWAAGIPGTVAGAVVGNAGAQGSSMADTVSAVHLATADGSETLLGPDDMGFGYRTSRLRGGEFGGAVVAVDLTLTVAATAACEARFAEHLARRRRTQPAGRSAGCLFANPAGGHAGALLDQCGLKGVARGDATVSPEHANFVLNRGGARAADVVALMSVMRRAVHERFGIVLESEVRLIGNIGLEAL
ncbi:MAG: UDP-N-acetylmuramate dehydrogenase [Anaerolineae bacterium]